MIKVGIIEVDEILIGNVHLMIIITVAYCGFKRSIPKKYWPRIKVIQWIRRYLYNYGMQISVVWNQMQFNYES
ncbi:hypothetical protein HYE37_00820 [Mycoplasmopsis bovis]|nr:hypothetical protein [Mycoplasmopsis bovis]QQH21253.1 hypothetical protein HYE37_00820 [Mycoplasmopsis bovis]